MSDSVRIVHLVLEYRYWVIFPLACIEGPLIAFLVGALAARDLFDIEFTFWLLLLGDIVPDFCCFLAGHYAARSVFFSRIVERTRIGFPVRAVTALWGRHSVKTMVIGKLSYGLSMPFLVSAGLSELSLWKFCSCAIPVSILQYSLFLTSGYYLGSHMNKVASVWHYSQIVMAAVLVLATLSIFVGARINRRFTSMSDCEC